MDKFFDRIYVITYQGLTDRQLHISQHFQTLGIQWEFRTAVQKELFIECDLSISEISLLQAHLHCLMDARLNKLNRVLICEDDVLFIANAKEEFQKFVIGLPSDWEYLQLGNQFWATHYLRRENLSQNLYRFKWGTGSHCIGIHSEVFDVTIQALETMKQPLDFLYYGLFQTHMCYCPETFLADALSGKGDLRFPTTITHQIEI